MAQTSKYLIFSLTLKCDLDRGDEKCMRHSVQWWCISVRIFIIWFIYHLALVFLDFSSAAPQCSSVLPALMVLLRCRPRSPVPVCLPAKCSWFLFISFVIKFPAFDFCSLVQYYTARVSVLAPLSFWFSTSFCNLFWLTRRRVCLVLELKICLPYYDSNPGICLILGLNIPQTMTRTCMKFC